MDGTAEAGSDYIPVRDTLVFEANQSCKNIEVEIIDDNEWEPDEVFFIKVSVESDQPARIGKRQICQVTILNDDGKCNQLNNVDIYPWHTLSHGPLYSL